MDKILTIYTATYNREALLPRVYESLCRQSSKDFKWLVIDDGSTDNTRALVEGWIAEDKLDMSYVYKENGGIHTVRDMAYQMVDTELVGSIDSDDYAMDDMVKDILSLWIEKGGDEVGGIIARNRFLNHEIKSEFPQKDRLTYQELYFQYGYTGDCNLVFYTDMIRRTPPSPVFQGEKLVAESWKYIQLPEIPLLLLDKEVIVKEYQEQGYSTNVRKYIFANLNGWRETKRQYMIHSRHWKPRLKGYMGYIMGSFFLKDWRFIVDSPKPVWTALLTPVGFAGYLHALRKWK